MTNLEWKLWHVIRQFQPISNSQLWVCMFGEARSRDEFKRALGFYPQAISEVTKRMAGRGYLINVNGPSRRGRIPRYITQ